MAETLTKHLGEAVVYAFDFATHAVILGGDALASVVSVVASVQGITGSAGLTLGTPAIATTMVTVLISGGVVDCKYKVTFKAITAGGRTIVGIGYLRVNDD